MTTPFNHETYTAELAEVMGRILGPWAGELVRNPPRRGDIKSDADIRSGDYTSGDELAQLAGEPGGRRVWP